jgi:arylsulfatase A-like enzyme
MEDVLLVTIDSLRADHVGHLGYERDTTPNIDALANEGTYCTNAFAHACSTRPSFPSILSSVYARMYGGYEQISEEQTLVSEALSDAGYRTGGFHSNLYLSADFGYDRGYDTFYDSKTDPSPTAKLRQAVKDRLDDDGLAYRTLARAFEVAERQAGTNIGSAYVSAEEITDRAVKWVDGRNDPTFLWVHYMDVHHPYVPPERHQRAFREEPISERDAIKLRRKMIEEPEAVTDEELSKLIDLYDAEIRYSDAEIGRLVDSFRERRGDDSTVLVTSDHGEEFTEHGRFSHYATFHDEVTHVPLVVAPHDAGCCEELVGLLDVSPTVADAAGVEQPETWRGESLIKATEADSWPREYILGDWENTDTDEERAYVRGKRWKLIDSGSGTALYDLDEDPEETTDVRADNPDTAAELEAVIADHRETVEETRVDIGDVEMEEQVKERLRDLGYQE